MVYPPDVTMGLYSIHEVRAETANVATISIASLFQAGANMPITMTCSQILTASQQLVDLYTYIINYRVALN